MQNTNIKYELLLDIIKNGLRATENILNKSEAFMKENNLDESEFLSSKLAEDMFDFKKQIQLISDGAKGNLARLAGKDPVSMEDNETTFAELRQRLAKTIEVVNTFKIEDFENSDASHITLPWMGGKYVEGKDFLKELAISNYMFHVSMAYAIMRMKGVTLVKSDFIGNLSLK